MKSFSNTELAAHLETILEVEFTFLRPEKAASQLVQLPRAEQDFFLDWTGRVASVNVQLAHEFVGRASAASALMPASMIEAWCLHAMDTYDRGGLFPAMKVIRELEAFHQYGHRRSQAALFEQSAQMLAVFVQGLSGRALKIELGEAVWTDGEVIYLPEMVADFDQPESNFQLLKALVVHQWALGRFGSLNINSDQFSKYADPERATRWFHALETVRLDALIKAQFPGLARQMSELRGLAADVDWADVELRQRLGSEQARAKDSLDLLPQYWQRPVPKPICYQGELRLQQAWQARARRMLRDEARVRHWMRLLCDENASLDQSEPWQWDSKPTDESWDLPQWQLMQAEQLVAPPSQVQAALQSLYLDLGELPPELLTPAGDGDYDPSLLRDANQDVDDVWLGTYHEEGAFLYDEWDFSRQGYRRNWCVLREVPIEPAHEEFYQATLTKYRGHVSSLRRSFELLRGENRVLRRQPFGEDVDMDAFVESWADARAGLEMSDRLFSRLRRDERHLAAIIMVDMSGSTKGWVNDAEREALILLAEALEVLGDRYAIYGFSGWARKRCELYPIKTFAQPLDAEVKKSICGIEAKDYTRMGAPIRHLTRQLQAEPARTKLLITLSDGKPDDYDHYYRGEYGIEDTRQALFEARRYGIHPYCITIDKQGADYLRHMYGRANYLVLDDVGKLPFKLSDIYKKITA